MATTRTYDLIIVGGGPAGAAAALYAHRRGLKTLLVDKETFPRDKVCGDALSGKSVVVLAELGLLDQVRTLPGVAIHAAVFGSPEHIDAWIDLRQYQYRDLLSGEMRPMEGFVIRRQVFDHFLFEEARKVADGCLEGFAVRELVVEDGQVKGVRGQQAGCGERVEYRGRLVLGCDGFNSVVARQAGLYRHDSQHLIVALRCYYENVAGLKDQIEFHFVDRLIPGYFWIFPLENGRANVGIGVVHKVIKRRRLDLKDTLRGVIDSPAFRDRFATSRPLEEPVGWSLPVGSRHRQSYGDGFLLLGDAAGLIDPFTGEGIGNALYSARFAVETAAEALREGDLSAGFLQRYDTKLWGALGDEMKVSHRLQIVGRWRFLLNMVIRKAAHNTEIRDMICGMMANAVPKKQLLHPLFYLKLLFK